ncbi:methylthioribose-1-phosphate isomerase [Holotrichia oblita]|uniref:Methylthioribose-1-phosphate isomerase n=1 Tax=Holotrichia oblita TaxID=644536 RepID=A0ACB9SYF7_HOLOL|nr:methylthioribose-1-phosphate isomerase [Holotrichia oblita]
MSLRAIQYEKGALYILDQLLLPAQSKYLQVKGVEDGWKVINKMQVRGAPAIAIVGCLSLAVQLCDEKYENKKELRQDIEGKLNFLVSSRPTAVNMKIATEELITLANELCNDESVAIDTMKARFISTIEAMLDKDIADNTAIGDHGAHEILAHFPGDTMLRVLTHCNTGSLATAGYGTALGVIRSLFASKRLGI